MVPKRAIERLIREIGLDAGATGDPVRFKGEAILALHEAAECYLTEVMQEANDNAHDRGRVTVMKTDLAVAVKMTS